MTPFPVDSFHVAVPQSGRHYPIQTLKTEIDKLAVLFSVKGAAMRDGFARFTLRACRNAGRCVAVAGMLIVPGVAFGQASFEVVRSIAPEPGFPWGRVLRAADGALYGTTYVGGPMAAGAVFRLDLLPDGTATRTTVHTFSGSDGRHPLGDLIQARDGALYGTTCDGGAEDAGIVFKLTTSGTFAVLHTFRPSVGDGSCPWAGLVEARDGNFYGSTNGYFIGGDAGHRKIFRIAPDGTFTNIYSFADAIYFEGPFAALTQARDGNFYGTTRDSIFRLTPDGVFTTLHTFSVFPEGLLPFGSLVEAPSGELYGTTTGYFFVNDGGGSVFKITTGGEFTFLGPTPGATGTLALGADGFFYGTSSLGYVLRMTPSGETTILHSFDRGQLYAGLIPAPDGTFYGTTTIGGPRGAGSVFKTTTSGDVVELTSFERSGLVPIAGLTQGTDGNLYGTTLRGGAHDNGSVFRMSPSGSATTLFSFDASFTGTPAASPGTVAKLFQAADGDFYGVADIPSQLGVDGTLFKMNSAGDVAVVHAFPYTDHELNPIDTGFVQGTDGDFYGTTQSFSSGGKLLRIAGDGMLTILHAFPVGCASVASLLEGRDGALYGSTYGCDLYGTIFRITAAGEYTLLHSFHSDIGRQPTGALIEGRDGNFYGTTRDGGFGQPSHPDGWGTIFRMTPTGVVTTLHEFDEAEGAHPFAGLAEGEDGAFYGTTPSGALGHGSVFRVDSSGAFTVVHKFTGGDGSIPYAPLTLARDGSLYGITPVGGTVGFGTIFRIIPGATLKRGR